VADPRFFKRAGPFKLKDLARIGSAELGDGSDPERVFVDVAPLESAGADQVSFLDNRRYVDSFRKSAAGACLVEPELADRAPGGMVLLLTKKPYRAYALIASAFYPEVAQAENRHKTAIVDDTAVIGPGVSIGPGAVIAAGAEIGAQCQIGPNAVIDQGVVVGEGTRVGANAYLTHCLVGRRCLIHAGVCIGNRGFGFAMDPEGFVDVPQLGRVVIEDGVEIGANSTIDRGSGPDTVIGAGSKIDNLVQIGHNVRLGRGCVLVAQSGIAGSTKLGDYVVVAAQGGVAGHLNLGTGAKIGAQAGVMRDVPDGVSVLGSPAMPARDYFKVVSNWQRQLKAKDKPDD
jgi:UDP-3-O-[3-hydroxymyristoyl] glucosamine N-acyltransferase